METGRLLDLGALVARAEWRNRQLGQLERLLRDPRTGGWIHHPAYRIR